MKRITRKKALAIPQHPLLTAHQWNRLRRGEIKKLTYHALFGPIAEYDEGQTLGYKHAFSVTITKEDCP